jgi:hypothetical protein
MRTKEIPVKKRGETRMKVSPKAPNLRTTENAARSGDDGTGGIQGQFTFVTRASRLIRLFRP